MRAKAKNVEDRNTRLDKEGEDTKKAATDAQNAAGQERSAAVAQVQAIMPAVGERTASSFSVSGSAPNFNVAFMGRTVDCNPFRSDRFGPVAVWFRAAFAWFVVGWFAVWLVGEIRVMIQGMAQAQQAKGASISVLGTGTTAIPALIVAGVITVAFVTALTAGIAYLSKDFGAGSVLGWVSGNPYSGAPGAIAYCLDQVFPLGVIAACLVSRVVFSLGLQTVFAVFASVVRFCLS